jgi:hypothetical protein
METRLPTSPLCDAFYCDERRRRIQERSANQIRINSLISGNPGIGFYLTLAELDILSNRLLTQAPRKQRSEAHYLLKGDLK